MYHTYLYVFVPAAIPKEGPEEIVDCAIPQVSITHELQVPGALPKNADDISKAARALLLRLLERNPSYRLKSMKQLKESAFYMGFNFEDVKAKKISPKCLLEEFEVTDNSLCNKMNSVSVADNFADFV